MTARDVYELSLALIDETESDGSVSSEYAESYADRAPKILDILQKELAGYEQVTLTGGITGLDDTLEISDDTAARIMPYGLAASFALADKNADMHSEYSYMYRSLIRTIRMDEADIIDEYEILGGLQ